MQPITQYRLAAHAGYAQLPLRTALLHADGRPTGCSIPGCTLRYQYRLGSGTLLITDWDCPYEEATDVLWLDAAFRIVARRHFGVPYANWLLDRADVIDERRLMLRFFGGPDVVIVLRDAAPCWSPAAWRSRLGVKVLR